MFERFTEQARRVVVVAQKEARLLDHGYIGTEHLLLGLISEGEGVAAKALTTLGAELSSARHLVAEMIGPGDPTPAGHLPFTPRAKRVLELSLREAIRLGHNHIGTEHMLLGLIREGQGVANQVLDRLGLKPPEVRTKVIELLRNAPEEATKPGSSLRRPDRCRHPDEALEIKPAAGIRTVRCLKCGTLIGVLPEVSGGEAS